MSRSLDELLLSDPAAGHALLTRLKENVMVPHPAQKQVLDSPARFKVLNAGRRFGKSKLGVKCMLQHALRDPEPGRKNRLIWLVAPTYRVVKRGYAETLRQLPRELLTHDPPPETSFDAGRSVTLRLRNGNRIEFYSAERPGGMLGEGVDYVLLDEAATIPSTVWQQIIRPTLMDTQGGGMLISTPRGRNWFYKLWQEGQKEGGDWASWTFTSYDNPYVEESEVRAMQEELPSLIFAQEALAKFVADGSNVFIWDERQVEKKMVADNGLVEDTSVSGHVFLGIDLAKTTDFTVLYGANEGNLRNVYYARFNSLRWSEQKRRIRRAVRLLEEQGADGVTLVMDSTGVGDPIVEDMEDAGFDVVGVNFTSTKDKMVRRLAKDLETGRCLLLDRDLDEFEDYQMSATATGKISYSAPTGQHDDVVAAKMLSHWGLTTEGAPNVTSITGGETVERPEPGEDFEGVGIEDDENLETGDWSDLIDSEPELYDVPDPAVIAAPGASLTPEELLALGAGDSDAWA